MAKKTVRVDAGYLSAFVPVRNRMGNYSAEMMGGGFLLSQPVLEAAYIHNGFTRIICDKPAEEMTRAGFTIVGMSEDAQKAVQARLEELDAVKHFNTALKWCRAFGGGLIVLGIKDGGTLLDQLNEDTITAVEFMRVYDRFECTVDTRYDDPAESNYGMVKLWRISPQTGGTSYLIDSSRVLIFDGESVPNSIRLSNDGWGSSVIQNCFVQLTRLDSAYKWSLLLLERMQQAIHGIPNLSEQVATPEGEANVTKRVNIVDSVRNALNTVIIDSEETYEIKNLSISGVNEILDRFIRALAAVCNIPAFLLGENITGLNTGSSNKEGWYAQVESWQNDKLRKPLDRLITFLTRADTEGNTDGGEYTIEFNPLFTPSDAEAATINKTEADTLTAYINNGVMDADEARTVVSDKFNLVGNAPEPLPEPDPVLDPIKLKPGEKLVPHPGTKAVPPANVGNKKPVPPKAK